LTICSRHNGCSAIQLVLALLAIVLIVSRRPTIQY